MRILYVLRMFLSSGHGCRTHTVGLRIKDVHKQCARLSYTICIMKKIRWARILDKCLNFPPNCLDVNIVFTFHYLTCISSMYSVGPILVNLLLGLILNNPNGCGMSARGSLCSRDICNTCNTPKC